MNKQEAMTQEKLLESLAVHLRMPEDGKENRYAPWTIAATRPTEEIFKIIDNQKDYPRPFADIDYEWERDGYGSSPGAGRGQQIDCAILHNPEINSYLVCLRDNRQHLRDLAPPEQNSSFAKPAVVHHKTIDGKGRNLTDILADAETIWASQLYSLYKFSPLKSDSAVLAMHEANSMKKAFDTAVANEMREYRTMPPAAIFKFFPAYRHTYEGKEGFYRSLCHVFNYGGTNDLLLQHKTWEVGHNQIHGNEPLYKKYKVTGHDLVSLYEKMNDADRADFKSAAFAFMRTLPALRQAESEQSMLSFYAEEAMRHLKLALDHGTGIYESAAFQSCYSHDRNMGKHIEDVIYDGSPTWNPDAPPDKKLNW